MTTTPARRHERWAKLLILDPFVRLHRIDENASSEVAPLLAYLRELQRRFHLAVLLVHHARKGGANMRAGQALRGSSEFHAWGDSNLYLRRHGDQLTLTVEHRAAPSIAAVSLQLAVDGDAVALAAIDHQPPKPAAAIAPRVMITVAQQIERHLSATSAPITIAALRKLRRMRTQTLCDALADPAA